MSDNLVIGLIVLWYYTACRVLEECLKFLVRSFWEHRRRKVEGQ